MGLLVVAVKRVHLYSIGHCYNRDGSEEVEEALDRSDVMIAVHIHSRRSSPSRPEDSMGLNPHLEAGGADRVATFGFPRVVH